MVELQRQSVRAQLGAPDPAINAQGASIRVLDLAVQCYVTGGTALTPNTAQGDEPYWLWLAPDRALFVAERDTSYPAGFVSDVTDGLAVFELIGARAREILATGCTLDPAVLAAGRCAQTLFGGVKVLLYAHADGIRLHVERQFAAFLLEWFGQAAAALG